MLNHLQKLQSRSHHERQVMTFVVALIVTALIAVIWLVTLFKPVREAITPTIPNITVDTDGVSQFMLAQWTRVENGWQVLQSYLK